MLRGTVLTNETFYNVRGVLCNVHFFSGAHRGRFSKKAGRKNRFFFLIKNVFFNKKQSFTLNSDRIYLYFINKSLGRAPKVMLRIFIQDLSNHKNLSARCKYCTFVWSPQEKIG